MTMIRASRLLFPAIRQVVWEPFEVPDTPEPHAVVAQTVCSLISAGTEIAVYTGTHIGFSLPEPPFRLIPFHPGYALVGRVIRLGAEVTGLNIGDRVVMDVPHGSVGIVDTTRGVAVYVPDGVADDDAAMVPIAGIALTAVRMAPVELGDTVVVYGLGLVGQLAARLYRLGGARPVIGIDRIPARLDIAGASGVVPINATRGDVVGNVVAVTGERGPDVVVEATGSPPVIVECLRLVREGGRVVLLGSPRGLVEVDAYSLIHRKGVTLIGAHERVQPLGLAPNRQWSKHRNLAFLARALADRDIDLRDLITHRIPAREAIGAFDALADRQQDHLGVLIDWREFDIS